ncbi:MAG TPA: ribosome-associated translation inhibitor RaiA [Anaerolineales bacterium]
MSNKVEIQARNMDLDDKIETMVKKKGGNLDHYLPMIDDVHVQFTHQSAARSAEDRFVAEITVHGKGLVLRTEDRADDPTRAFDVALDHMQRQIERYKGKHYHNRAQDRRASGAESESASVPETGRLPPLIARRKKFQVMPMNAEEAVGQMQLLGHDNFFIFYNGETNMINVLYRRRDGTYGLIEPEIG